MCHGWVTLAAWRHMLPVEGSAGDIRWTCGSISLAGGLPDWYGIGMVLHEGIWGWEGKAGHWIFCYALISPQRVDAGWKLNPLLILLPEPQSIAALCDLMKWLVIFFSLFFLLLCPCSLFKKIIFVGKTFEVKFLSSVVCKEDKLYVFDKEKVT